MKNLLITNEYSLLTHPDNNVQITSTITKVSIQKYKDNLNIL